MKNIGCSLVALCLILHAASAAGASNPAALCRSGKLKLAGKYGACRLNLQAKAAKTGGSPDFTRCAGKFSSKWQAAEARAGAGVCPSENDQAAIQGRISDHSEALATLLAGGSLPPASGGGFPATGQTVSYGSGDDGNVQAGAALAYVDNGDGTISDPNTGLMWEKKVAYEASGVLCSNELGSCANPHDADNVYSWTASGSSYDGSVNSIFLEQLNNRCSKDPTVACNADVDCAVPGGACGFAGHRDWRLPNQKELVSILDYGAYDPAVDVVFHGASCGPACTDIGDPACSCDASFYYWSSTTASNDPTVGWYLFTTDGYANVAGKGLNFSARAVRGGS